MTEEKTETDYLSIKFFRPSDTMPSSKKPRKSKDGRTKKERNMTVEKYAERAKKRLPLFEELDD